MESIKQRLAAAYADIKGSIDRLSSQEQLIVILSVSLLLLVMLMLTTFGGAGYLKHLEHRIETKSTQISTILTLSQDYTLRMKLRSARLAKIAHEHVRLVSRVEEAARAATVEIGQLRPEEGEANADGISESRVALRAAELSADKLQQFLRGIEGNSDLIFTKHLKINRPYRKDTAELDMTVSTYKSKTAG